MWIEIEDNAAEYARAARSLPARGVWIEIMITEYAKKGEG